MFNSLKHMLTFSKFLVFIVDWGTFPYQTTIVPKVMLSFMKWIPIVHLPEVQYIYDAYKVSFC